MTFWARSDRDGNITVNCMQNHEPWDHHTQKKMPVSTEWKQMNFAFIAPWDDNNVRISFTDLATVPGQVYWFADCSLVPASKVKTAATPSSRSVRLERGLFERSRLCKLQPSDYSGSL